MNKLLSLWHSTPRSRDQKGVTLIMVLLILVVVSLLGVGGAQIALMSERGARNDRDQQLAWQSAEAGLIDAETDLIYHSTPALCASAFPASCPSTRPRGDWLFDGASTSVFLDCVDTSSSIFNDSLGTSGASATPVYKDGMCKTVSSGNPAWLAVDFTDTSSDATTVAFGTYTGANFVTGEVGVQPALAPHYIIEPISTADLRVEKADASGRDTEIVYRVTVMGFGPRTDIQAVVQMLYRI
jgi:type IV pilus assembly protein PilX